MTTPAQSRISHPPVPVNPRIAIVDDDLDLRFITRAMIGKEFAEAQFVEFSTAQEMLDHLKDHRVDAIVSDYQLGTMDGITMIQTIRKTDTATPIVMASGRDDIRDQALAAGATLFLTFGEQRQLGEVIKRLLSSPV